MTGANKPNLRGRPRPQRQPPAGWRCPIWLPSDIAFDVSMATVQWVVNSRATRSLIRVILTLYFGQNRGIEGPKAATIPAGKDKCPKGGGQPTRGGSLPDVSVSVKAILP